MKKTIILAAAIIFILAMLAGSTQAIAQDNSGKKVIQLDITFGAKDDTARDFDIFAKPQIKVLEGEPSEIIVEDAYQAVDLKLEATAALNPENPEEILLKVKAWRILKVTKDGKTEKQLDPLVDQDAKVKKGATMFAVAEISNDRSVQITITPTY